jgi:hypothetical protein
VFHTAAGRRRRCDRGSVEQGRPAGVGLGDHGAVALFGQRAPDEGQHGENGGDGGHQAERGLGVGIDGGAV